MLRLSDFICSINQYLNVWPSLRFKKPTVLLILVLQLNLNLAKAAKQGFDWGELPCEISGGIAIRPGLFSAV